MEDDNNEVVNNNLEKDNEEKSDAFLVILLDILFPIIYFIVTTIAANVFIYRNWREHYFMIFEAGYAAKNLASPIALLFIALYGILILKLKLKHPLKLLLIMMIIMYFAVSFFCLLNSWA